MVNYFLNSQYLYSGAGALTNLNSFHDVLNDFDLVVVVVRLLGVRDPDIRPPGTT